MPSWPSTLPQNPYAEDGATYEPVDNVIRSSMEYGPAKLRRRFTGKLWKFTFQTTISTAQVATLDTFYNTTLAAVGRFQWLDFRTGAVAYYRFIAEPAMMYVAHRTPMDPHWQMSIQLELVP